MPKNKQTLGQYLGDFNLTVKEMISFTEESHQTLDNWYKNRKTMFFLLVLGAYHVKNSSNLLN